eukprot:15447290-Alexandrium_andersonii.AAC.1
MPLVGFGLWVLGFGRRDRSSTGGPRVLVLAMPMARCGAASPVCPTPRAHSLRTSGIASMSTRPWAPVSAPSGRSKSASLPM